jgi:hypothetical protein
MLLPVTIPADDKQTCAATPITRDLWRTTQPGILHSTIAEKQLSELEPQSFSSAYFLFVCVARCTRPCCFFCARPAWVVSCRLSMHYCVVQIGNFRNTVPVLHSTVLIEDRRGRSKQCNAAQVKYFTAWRHWYRYRCVSTGTVLELYNIHNII